MAKNAAAGQRPIKAGQLMDILSKFDPNQSVVIDARLIGDKPVVIGGNTLRIYQGQNPEDPHDNLPAVFLYITDQQTGQGLNLD